MPRLTSSIIVANIMLMISLASLVNGAYAVRSFSDLIGYSESTIEVLPEGQSSESEIDATCQPIHDVYVKDLLVRDMQGKIITETTVGSQIVIEATKVNDCGDRDSQLLLALFEVRDSRGFSIYIAFQNGTINSNERNITGTSWLAPNEPGEYLVRGFGITCLGCPQVLSNALTYKLAVLPAS